ncbi:MAG: hypothetical protein HYT03_00935 [Candidatus Harrisonbacteria bacterium]|nr:hypothetical protein [Candidatus Harrisonbacteria bacterium]
MKKVAGNHAFEPLLRACDLWEPRNRWFFNEDVVQLSERDCHHDTMSEFEILFQKVAEDILKEPFASFKSPEYLEKLWQLALTPQPLRDWDYMAFTDPEKSGILCRISGHGNLLITPEILPGHIWKEDENRIGKNVERVFALECALRNWRILVKTFWASRIIEKLMRLMNKNLTLSWSNINDEEIAGEQFACLSYSNEQADEFCEMVNKSARASGECEERTADAFKKYLALVNVGTLRGFGLSSNEAGRILLASNQNRPRMKLSPKWNQETRNYQFFCYLGNGFSSAKYINDDETAIIPGNIFFNFCDSASIEIKTNLTRLLLRDGLYKARDLICDGLIHSE